MPNQIPEMADADRVVETWTCTTCGLRFLTYAVPFIRCITAHHCHAGDLMLCPDGMQVYVPHPLDCEIISMWAT